MDKYAGHLGPPKGDGYFATGTTKFHGGAPVWVHSGGDLAEVVAAAAEFVASGVEVSDASTASIWYVDPDGRAQPNPILITWEPF